MRSVNKVILVGHLAADPETFQTKTGKTRVSFPVTVHRDSTSEGLKKDVTDYQRVVSWESSARSAPRTSRRGTAGSTAKGSVMPSYE
jgi:single-stranded DNA-binding protein